MGRADKLFRYLLGSRSRDDLDDRLETFRVDCLHKIFDNVEDQTKYWDYLLYTRFAGEGHPAYLPGDRRARSHTLYGQHSAPDMSAFNMNLEV